MRKVVLVGCVSIVAFLLASLTVFAEQQERWPDLKGKTLTMAYMASGTYDVAAETVAPEFERLTGARIQIDKSPYLTLYEKILTDLISQTGTYDVVTVASQWDGQFSNFVVPLEEYLEKYGVDLEKFVCNIRKNVGFWNGKTQGLPMACDVYGLVYRTDVLAEAGVRPPVTWDELESLAARLTGNGIYGYSIVGTEVQLRCHFATRFWALGGQELTPDWEPNINNEYGLRAAKYMKDILPYCPPGVMSISIPEQTMAFLNGKLAMAEVWPSYSRGVINDPEKSKVLGRSAICPVPGATGEFGCWDMAIPKTAKDKDASFAWIKFYTLEENQKRFFKEWGMGPTRMSLYQDPELMTKYPSLAPMLPSLMRAKARPRIPQSEEMCSYQGKQLSAYLVGELTAEEMLEKVEKKWKELIAANPPEVKYTP